MRVKWRPLTLLLVAVSVSRCYSDTPCATCGVGFGVSRPCNATSGSACVACVNGATFSDTSSDSSPCRPCSACPAHSRVRQPCTAARDTLCECDKNHYQQPTLNDLEVTLTCKPCDLCPHGWGATRPCDATHNTVCRKCPQGTYSSVVSASRACVVCATCREDQLLLHPCTPIQDTVCIDKDLVPGYSNRRLIARIDNLSIDSSGDYYSNQGIIFVYCAILAAVVFGLLVYVVVKQWSQRHASVKFTACDTRYAAVPVKPSLCAEDLDPPQRRMSQCRAPGPGDSVAATACGCDACSRGLQPCKLENYKTLLTLND